MYDEPTLVDRLTQMLLDKGCTVNKPAMTELAKFVVDEQASALREVTRHVQKMEDRLTRMRPLEEAS